MELNEILDETPEKPEPAVETPETPKPDLGARKAFQEKEQAAQEEGRSRTADGKFAPKDEEPKPEAKPEPKPVSQDLTEKERAFLARANDETRKRQALEQEIAQLRARATPQEPQKTFYEDPDGVLRQVEERIAQQNQNMQQAFIQQRVQSAEVMARGRHADFDEMVPVFGELLKATPGLYQQWMLSPDPAEFAYQAGKNITQLLQAGSIGEIRKQAEKEARIKLEQEYKAKEEALLKKRSELPDSLSEARSAAAPKVSWGGPPSLVSILSDKQ